jgi:hypothetical protein
LSIRIKFLFVSDFFLPTAKHRKKRDVKNIERERSPIQIYAIQLTEPLNVTVEYARHWFLLFAELRIWNVILEDATNDINFMFSWLSRRDGCVQLVAYLQANCTVGD